MHVVFCDHTRHLDPTRPCPLTRVPVAVDTADRYAIAHPDRSNADITAYLADLMPALTYTELADAVTAARWAHLSAELEDVDLTVEFPAITPRLAAAMDARAAGAVAVASPPRAVPQPAVAPMTGPSRRPAGPVHPEPDPDPGPARSGVLRRLALPAVALCFTLGGAAAVSGLAPVTTSAAPGQSAQRVAFVPGSQIGGVAVTGPRVVAGTDTRQPITSPTYLPGPGPYPGTTPTATPGPAASSTSTPAATYSRTPAPSATAPGPVISVQPNPPSPLPTSPSPTLAPETTTPPPSPSPEATAVVGACVPVVDPDCPLVP